jgi:5'-nucleotidase
VLVDHLVPGSKEARVADAVRDPNVLVLGTPFVDIWAAIRPKTAGIDAWPDIPKGTPWKEGICSALGVADPPRFWQQLLATVNDWSDIDQTLVASVEQLIDFVTAPGASAYRPAMRRPPAATTLAAWCVLVAACSSGSSSTAAKPSAPKPATLHILVTNDDGFDAPGIDVVTEALRKLPKVSVTVVAPATNKSGTGSQTTPGTLTATKRTTASGYPATAVDGFPSDAVRYALDTLHLRPDVVVSGINAGQNLGSISQVSGTVGAAKAAAGRGIPAIAASQGLPPNPPGPGSAAAPRYDVGAQLVLDWIEPHRRAFLGHTATVGVVNLNIPSCDAPRGPRDAPLAADAAGATEPPNCSIPAAGPGAPATDVQAFHEGYASVTQLTAEGKTVTTSTTFPTKSSG